MKYAIALSLISSALVAGAFVYTAAAPLLCWASLSFGLVALGYAGIGARVFGKGTNGRIPLPQKVVLLPFLFYSWFVWHLYRLMSREDAFNTIDDKLVVGRRLLPPEVPEEFDYYIDLTAEFEDPASIRLNGSYISFPIMDADIPSVEDLTKAVEAVKSGKIYIHCAQGHGRTGLFALAVLVHRGRTNSAADGIDLLRSIRPGITLNRKQTRFVQRYTAQRVAPDKK